MEDSVFVVSLLTAPASIHVNSGGTDYTYDAPSGASAQAVPMNVGVQSFSVTRNGANILSGTSLKPIIDGCVCGLYNFNAYGKLWLYVYSSQPSSTVLIKSPIVGTLPAGFSDPLRPDGLAAFRQGLHVETCEASPSLGTVPPTASITSTTTLSTSTISTTSATTSTITTSTLPTTSTTTSSSIPQTTSCQGYTSTTTHTFTATIIQTTTQTQTVTVSATSSTTGGSGKDVCTGGTGPGNYIGLCLFCCQFGYCPPGPCTCIRHGSAVPPPPSTGVRGVPLPGEGDSYLGLCSFACDHGYCPPTACTTA